MHALLRLLLVALLAGGLSQATRAQWTGPAVPEMASYDTILGALFDQYAIPGASVAVSRNGKLVYARGYGLADKATSEPVQPGDRFRIASISKPITGVAIMKLVEDGLLGLDDPAFAYLPDLPAPAGQTEDPRLGQITIRMLLQHTGGWDRDGTGYDPMFDVVRIATALGVQAPASVEDVVRYMRGRPLNFAPGAKYAYSNFGYAVLGRIIERVAGMPYDAYVQSILAPTGISTLALGRSLDGEQLPDEVRYYEYNNATATSVFPPYATVPWPYGGFEVEVMDAHGGWVVSAPDLLRFAEAIDGRTGRPDILTATSLATIKARPSVWGTSGSWYGLGWSVNTNGHWWHNGSLPGTNTLLVRSNYQNLSWTVLCNTRPEPDNGFTLALDNAMWQAALAITTWPTHDLFDQFVAQELDTQPGAGFNLSQAAPNPMHGSTTFRPALDRAATVRVTVYDLLGRELLRVHDGDLGAGTHTLQLAGAALPSGVYLVRATTDAGAVVTRRVVRVH